MSNDLKARVDRYLAGLAEAQQGVVVTAPGGAVLAFAEGVGEVIRRACETHANGRKVMVIGNGGSAAIASHVAIDASKNGRIRTTAFNDGALLTCLANDFGYERVFEKAVEMHGQAGDLLIAISSSGRSPNILRGVAAARTTGCAIVTLSGFARENPLRGLGDVNFYVPSDAYGHVEVTHLGICQAIVDLAAGWTR